jgi:hypothetical protein
MRKMRVAEIGPDLANDSIRYSVEITGDDARVFEVRVSNSALASAPRSLLERIEQLYAHGPLPEHGEVVSLGSSGW